ncbi:MAG: ABC-F family ATP-binding cassette domain-containing protein [Myxococcales bacterium]|nr:ABC-F family ATP-binding cassette domain-containing protein [Myxococcales bacterium]
MLVVKDLSLFLGGRALVDQLNWQMKPQERVALIGGNGAGKSTFMKVVAGLIEPDSGDILVPKGTSFGYLPQDGIHFRERSLYDEVVSAQQEVLRIERDLKELEAAMGTIQSDDDQSQLLERYDMLSERFRYLGGYNLESEVGRVLDGLGFTRADWERSCETFSGGWQMRIALARLLLQRPNWLLLDEPTNHLDLDARNWLEGYLKDYPSGILMVSHDRFFIDSLVRRCGEIYNGKITDYEGNFSYYEVERERRYEALEEKARRQAEEIEKIESFINRFRYQASKATQVQSRVKQLEKIERIELPPRPSRNMSFSFPKPPRSGKEVLQMQHATKHYDDLCVLEDVDVMVERGERVALVGVNGAGKSTLMRMMAGTEPFVGERQEGYQVKLSFFAQDQTQALNLQHTVLQSLEEVAPYEMMPQLRTLLGCFLFQGDDVFKKISVLSGGEKSRVALARMLMQPANLLLMDEPTNHLDMSSQQVLLQALKQYEGTVIFVSHDRFFIDQLATRVIEIQDRKTTSYLGNYEEYIQKKISLGLLEGETGVRFTTEAGKVGGDDLPKPRTAVASASTKESSGPREQRQMQYYETQQVRREYERKRRGVMDEIASLESSLEKKEERLAELEEQMSDAGFYEDYERSAPIIAEYDELKEEIAQGYALWEELQVTLEEIEAGAPL